MVFSFHYFNLFILNFKTLIKLNVLDKKLKKYRDDIFEKHKEAK